MRRSIALPDFAKEKKWAVLCHQTKPHYPGRSSKNGRACIGAPNNTVCFEPIVSHNLGSSSPTGDLIHVNSELIRTIVGQTRQHEYEQIHGLCQAQVGDADFPGPFPMH